MCLSCPRVVRICVYCLPPACLVSVLCWFLHPTRCSVCLFVFWPFLPPRLEAEARTAQYVFHVNNPVVINLFLGDITQALLSRWSNLTTILPTSQHDLMAYLNRPLKESDKVPLSHYSMTTLVSRGEPKIMCSESDLQRIFRSSEDEEADYLWTILKMAIVTSAPDSDGTQASFISFWDDNIRKIISAIFTPSKIIRENNRGTCTALQRPNFGIVQRGVCAFRGEEKAARYAGKHPRDELFDKLVWTYYPAPWILGPCFNLTSSTSY